MPRRVRGLLNTESDDDDGAAAPLFMFGVALLAGGPAGEEEGLAELSAMVPAAGWAVLVGLVVDAAFVAGLVHRAGAGPEQEEALVLAAAVASIVFALLALPHLSSDLGGLVLQILGIPVVMSAVAHGLTAPLAARRFGS